MSSFFAGIDDEVGAQSDGAQVDQRESQEDEQNEKDHRRFSNRGAFVASCVYLASCHFLVPGGEEGAVG